MSTRRSTRASSAGSHAMNPTGVPNTPVAKAGRKKAASSIASELGPQQILTGKESTSYGSSTAVVPLQMNQVGVADLAGALTGIAGPAASQPSATLVERSASFGSEIGTAGNATFAAGAAAAATGRASAAAGGRAGTPLRRTVARRSNTITPIAEEPEEPSAAAVPAAREATPATPVVRRRTGPKTASVASGAAASSGAGSATANSTRRIVARRRVPAAARYVRARELVGGAVAKLATPVVLVVIVLFLAVGAYLNVADNSAGRASRHYAREAKHAVGHYVPHVLVHPLNYFNEDDMLDVQQRLRLVERDVAKLQADVLDNHQLAMSLSARLPSFLVAKTVKGKVQIPLDFWRALRANILADPDLRPAAIKDAKSAKPAAPAWKDFLLHNEARLHSAIAADVVLAKADLLTHLETALAASASSHARDLAALHSRVSADLAARPSALSTSQVKTLADQAVQRALTSQRIEDLVTAHVRDLSVHALRRPNHFAPGAGAVTLPRVTTPTFAPVVVDRRSVVRTLFGWVPGTATPASPRARKPVDALTRWDEQGDCWCGATAADADGAGVQLGVATLHDIYPDELVVEHLPRSATLDPGAAPRHMELFAQIPLGQQDDVAAASAALFPNAPAEQSSKLELDDSWVRVAQMEYDVRGRDGVQVFPVQLDLGRYGVSARQFVVRARDNWGGVDGVEGGKGHTCFYRVRLHGGVAKEGEN